MGIDKKGIEILLEGRSLLSAGSVELLEQTISMGMCYNTFKLMSGMVHSMKLDNSDEFYDAARVDIGRKIKEARETQRLPAYEVAKRAGVSQPTITDIENGKKWSNIAIYARICNALGLKISELLSALDGDEQLTDEEMMLIYELRQALIKQRKARELIAGTQNTDD